MEKDPMEQLDDLINEGIVLADGIRETTTIREFQTKLMDFAKEKDLNALCGKILEIYPGKRQELMLKIMAFTAEGKLVKDSLLRR